MVKISVIVPIYNASKYLKSCIDSILSQSFKDIELILVDDGSTDESLKICYDFKKNDQRIKVISGPNGGVSEARNKGLESASGEWITFVDSDDYFLEDALLILYDRAMQTGANLVMANSLKLINGTSLPLHKLTNEVLPNKIYSIKHFALWGYLFKANIITENKLKFIKNLAYSEDRIFIYQVARYCNTIAFINKPIYVYRINEDSACYSNNGIKKAFNQIEASYYVDCLAQTYLSTNYKIYNHLHKQSKHIIKLGLYSFVENSISIKLIQQVKNKFYQRFGNSWKMSLFFYYNIFLSFITYKRRKVIRLIK